MNAYVELLAREAQKASRDLAGASTEQKNRALEAAAQALRAAMPDLLAANARDVALARHNKASEAFIDRLVLNEERVDAMASALEDIVRLNDPVGRTTDRRQRPNGLMVRRVSVPLGVIGMIYESRPNVGADAGALCIKSGNAVILRGGSESRNSSRVIVDCMQQGLKAAGLPPRAIQMVDTKNRNAVTEILRCTRYIDLVIPRGGKGLVSLVQSQARVPTLLHLDGNNHTYVHAEADIDKAVAVVRNAKLRRTGICGATEGVVVDQAVAPDFLQKLVREMPECDFVGDGFAQGCDARIGAAEAADWDTEYLAPKLSVKTVSGIDEALAFITEHSSRHTDAILTEDGEAARRFLREIDSAIVMHNASTQFADGGEFGMGAEIGIATGKMHARGPVGLEQLTTFKYEVLGDGQIRP